MGIMLLAQQGRLKLDDTLAQHIPELGRYRDVTITQMLQHTSGLPDHMWLADKYWDPDVVLTTQGMIALFVQH
jgi:CubicO group peptidase (beta-lactamase class C family)